VFGQAKGLLKKELKEEYFVGRNFDLGMLSGRGIWYFNGKKGEKTRYKEEVQVP
jgi:hypothetical protein